MLDNATKEMRRHTDNKFFKFDEEDRVVSFDKRKYIKDTNITRLREVAKVHKIKKYTAMTHWQLYSEICKLPDLDAIVCDLIAKDKVYNIYAEDLVYMANHELTPKDITYSKGDDIVDLDRLHILHRTGKACNVEDNEEDFPF